MKKNFMSTVLLVMFFGNLTFASQTYIHSAAAMGVREDPLDRYLLSGLLIKKSVGGDPFEDRTFLEYDISGLSLGAGESVVLDIVEMRNIDPDDPAGVVDVYTYYGDGVVTVDDFDAGGASPYYSFDAPGVFVVKHFSNGTLSEYLVDHSIDVTDFIANAIAANQQYVGFRLSTLTSDRYDFAFDGRPIPTLNVIPEPCTVCLLGVGAMMLRHRRKN